MEKTDLLGAWKLITYKVCWAEDNEQLYPYGSDAKGYLIYTSNHVSIHVMRSERRQCLTQDFKGIQIDEKIEMADNYNGYVGTYEIRQNMIIHYPEISMYHNFTLVPQERQFRIQDNHLILECPYFCKGKTEQGRSQLIWKRIEEV